MRIVIRRGPSVPIDKTIKTFLPKQTPADLFSVGKGATGRFAKAAKDPAPAQPLREGSSDLTRRYRVLAIDPATHAERVGIAVLSVPITDTQGKPIAHQAKFNDTGRTRIRPRIDWAGTLDQLGMVPPSEKGGGEWRMRSRDIAVAVRGMFMQAISGTAPFSHPSITVIEVPMNYQTVKGQAAALAGDLLALAYTTGKISAVVGERNRLVLEVEPPTWKGQLPKQVTAARLAECYGPGSCPKNPNAIDAVGLAHWFLMQRTPAETERCTFAGSVERQYFTGWL